MALSERSRSILYASFSSVVHDPEALQDMLSHFPARDVEEPVTKEHLRAEMAVQRAELQAEFGAFRVEFAALRSEVQADLVAMRGEMASEFSAVRGEMASEFAAVRGEVAELGSDIRVELRDALRQQTQWLIGVMVTLCSLLLVVSAFIR